ncbi:hypothetical protein L207DRAFT_510398 [Hyaloscypha variabilis F]|uniref:Uncharacterized protein n=1 Tax=Hyaloscypha variabilis (strain UAMH 11265 / GT02V1 / F) TaxID=1149755 RepID=A0A2J6RUI5_HYAVF|nr:hypothetical protein L207DRAFT_510398 [Hyaloscypha variabilis F]
MCDNPALALFLKTLVALSILCLADDFLAEIMRSLYRNCSLAYVSHKLSIVNLVNLVIRIF